MYSAGEPGSVSPADHRGEIRARDVHRPTHPLTAHPRGPPSRPPLTGSRYLRRPGARLCRALTARAAWGVCVWRARRDVVDGRAFLTFLRKLADFCRLRKTFIGKLLRESPGGRRGVGGQKVVICARARRTFVPQWGAPHDSRFAIPPHVPLMPRCLAGPCYAASGRTPLPLMP